MSLKQDLDDVYCAACQISQGINALELMAMGLAQVQDPHADGFNALYNYLFDANQELRTHLETCMDAT